MTHYLLVLHGFKAFKKHELLFKNILSYFYTRKIKYDLELKKIFLKYPFHCLCPPPHFEHLRLKAFNQDELIHPYVNPEVV